MYGPPCWREIARRRQWLPFDLRADPRFAVDSGLWDRWFIPGEVPEARLRSYFAARGDPPAGAPVEGMGEVGMLAL